MGPQIDHTQDLTQSRDDFRPETVINRYLETNSLERRRVKGTDILPYYWICLPTKHQPLLQIFRRAQHGPSITCELITNNITYRYSYVDVPFLVPCMSITESNVWDKTVNSRYTVVYSIVRKTRS